MLRAILFVCIFLTSSFCSAQSPIVIGAIYNLTGAQGSLDKDSLNGAELAVEQINTNNGLLGRPVKLVVENGQTKPEVIKQVATRLAINKDVIAVIGLSDTDMASAAIPILAKHKKIFITSGATGANLPALAPGWVFLACFVDSQQASVAAEFAKNNLHAKNILLITQEDNHYARMLNHYFKISYLTSPVHVIKELTFNHQALDLTQSLARLKSNKRPIDLVYLAAGPQMSLKMITQLRAAGFTQPIMGGDSFDSDYLAQYPAKDFGTLYFTTHAFVNQQNKELQVQEFIKSYQEKYNAVPQNAFSGLGYDTVRLLAQAIRNADSVDTDKIRNALLNMREFRGVTGVIHYVEHFVPNKSVTMVKFENGKRSAVALN